MGSQRVGHDLVTEQKYQLIEPPTCQAFRHSTHISFHPHKLKKYVGVLCLFYIGGHEGLIKTLVQDHTTSNRQSKDSHIELSLYKIRTLNLAIK